MMLQGYKRCRGKDTNTKSRVEMRTSDIIMVNNESNVDITIKAWKKTRTYRLTDSTLVESALKTSYYRLI
jgi:hypothetical protein